MPDAIRKGGSIFILGTYVTAIAVGATFFFGREYMAWHDSKAKVDNIEETVNTTQDAMAEFIQYSHENRIHIQEHHIEMGYCKDRITNCEKAHRKYHHGMGE